MSDGKKFLDVDDYDNIENAVKKILPGFTAISRRMAGPVANFSQQELSAVASIKKAPEVNGFKKHELYLISKGINHAR